MSSYRIKLSSSKDGAVVFLNASSPDILDVFNAPEDSKIADTTKASIPLIRRGARDFADEMGESLINMLENFAAQTPPTKPLMGQLWFQKTPTGNYLRYCMNPTGSTVAQTWGYVGTSVSTPNDNATKVNLSGDVNTNLPVSFTANSNNEINVVLNLPEVMGSVQNPVDTNTVYTLPQIKVDKKGRIVKITQGAAAPTGVPWATATPTQVNVDRNLNTAGKLMEGGNALLPTGSIIMWYGSVSSIPLGWRLCNGQNGTPDLRDRFVMGAGGGIAAGQRGGSSTLNASGTTSVSGAHDHPVSISSAGAHSHGGNTSETALTIDQMPRHQHATGWGENNYKMPIPKYGTKDNSTNNPGSNATDFDNLNYLSEPVGGSLGHAHAIPSDGNHTHSGTASSAGAHSHTMSVSGDLTPPYHALCYIMKA